MLLAVLAQEQPVAGDMRRIVAALTMVNDLERIGDHGKRIAKISLRMEGTARPFPFGDVARAQRACPEHARSGDALPVGA